MSSNIPDQTWTLERLGDFCTRSQKRLAVEAWRFGHALNMARAKQAHGDWHAWKQKYVPGLGHSSEHRYRTLARRLTEDALVGIGLTEAYRLLDLATAKRKTREGDAPVPRPVPVGADDPDAGRPADTATAAVSPTSAHFRGQTTFIGPMEIESPPDPPRVATGPMESDAEPDDAPPLAAPAPDDARSPAERYHLYLLQARNHLESLQSWADWLNRQDEGFRAEMWKAHRAAGVTRQIEKTVERLRWVAENLEP